jgi:site-specific recombinase XerD
MHDVDRDAGNDWPETETPDEEKRRRASDFLRYQDSNGKFADFHALRHTFITNLGRAGIASKTAQTLARHSDISLTMPIYTHVDQAEQEEAINPLPPLPGMERPKDDTKEK